MITIVYLKKEDIKIDIDDILEKNTKTNSGKSNIYNNLGSNYTLNYQVIKKQHINKMLPWVNTTISNANSLFLDAHH